MNDPSIQCDLCDNWNHIDCVGISNPKYEKLKEDPNPWYCPNCVNLMPFSSVKSKELANQFSLQSTPDNQRKPIKKIGTKTRETRNKFRDLNQLFDQTEHSVSCDYYNLTDFRKVKNTQQDLSILHLNISSLSAHINDLKTFLNLVDSKFDIICISESRLSLKHPQTTNIELPGYNIEHIPTESAAGGVLMYISQKLSYQPRKDLHIYSPKELESVFIHFCYQNCWFQTNQVI